MKKYIAALLIIANIFGSNAGFGQPTKKHHRNVAGCPIPPKHHKIAKHIAKKKPTMRYETITLDDHSPIAIVDIRKGYVYVNDSLVAKLANPKYEDENIIINYIVPPPAINVDVSKENSFTAIKPKPMLGIYPCNYCGEGAIIEDILPCSPADKAGLSPGDVIKKINDQDIDNSDELINAIGNYVAGDNISITYTHFGKTETTEAELTERKKMNNCGCPEMEPSYGCNDCYSDKPWRW